MANGDCRFFLTFYFPWRSLAPRILNVNAASVWGDVGSGQFAVPIGDVLAANAPAPSISNLLTGVSHSAGGTLWVNLVTPPTSGTVVLGTDSETGLTDGTFTYTPGTTTGWVYFTYDISSSDGSTSPPITAAINVTDSLPEATPSNQSVWTYQGQAQDIDMRLPYVDPEHPLNTLKAALVPGMGPQNGTLTDNGDGTYTYVPDPGYTGPDYFTYQMADAITQSTHGTTSQSDKLNSGYETAFVDVRPLPVSLAVDGFAPGDPNATLPLDGGTGTATLLHLNFPNSLPAGSTVTLTVNAQANSAAGGGSTEDSDISSLEVFDPGAIVPDPRGLILGGSAGQTYTWTVGSGEIPPQTVILDALGPVNAIFELLVTPGDNSGGSGGPGIFGDICLATPGGGGANPASQPALAGQRATTQRAGILPFKVLPTFTIGVTDDKGPKQGDVYPNLPGQILKAFNKEADQKFASDYVVFYNGLNAANEKISPGPVGDDAEAVAGWVVGFDFSQAKVIGGNFGTPDLSACVVDYMPYTILFSNKSEPNDATDYTVGGIPQFIVAPSVAQHELWHTDGNVGVPIQWAHSATATFGNGVDPGKIKRYGGFAQGAFDQWWNVAEPGFENFAKVKNEPGVLVESDAISILRIDVLSDASRGAVTDAGKFHDANEVYLTGLPPAP